jgi:hypothetical protein
MSDLWAELQKDDLREVARARASIERILTNIRKGFGLAAASR